MLTGWLLAGLSLLAACADGRGGAERNRPAGPPPWQRTEEREACEDFDLTRRVYFGDLHIHTLYSADAYIFGTRGTPREAYEFARGGAIAVADQNEAQTRTASIDRPLDFAAVTDHAEFLGEVALCHRPGSPLFDHEMCQLLRSVETPETEFSTAVRWLYPAGIPNPPASHSFCFLPGIDCDAAAASVWQEMQAAAEEAYDRSARCTFTTFIGYEHTASPLGRHLHRNVIFRNHNVPALPPSQLETASEGIPQGIWNAIEASCLRIDNGCDAVLIPHNSNLSGGDQWLDPADASEARRRQDLEPLVEIHQQKGGSECRFDRLSGRGVGTEDELCTFEQLLRPDETPGTPVALVDGYPRRNLVRNALKDGLALEQRLGVNPFRLGFVASTDTHNATSGDVAEAGWDGSQGRSDSTDAQRIADKLRYNPGGLAAVWAEENSRDALFAALRRRETYATSGPRMIVRFFAGALAGADCAAPDLVERAYETATPMGGVIGPVHGEASPRFVVLALKDPGTDGAPGTDLASVQIVKGWVDDRGETHERVFEVARAGNGSASVDPATCAPVGEGARQLCAAWQDPSFDRRERAFYYARVLENPSCRWTTLVCKRAGVDPFSADCAAQAAAGAAFADCCLTEDQDPFHQRVIQERAWTSPVWYEPEAIAGVEGGITFGAQAGEDTLDLTLRIGKLPSPAELATAEVEIVLSDDDEIRRVTIAPGLLAATDTPGLLSLPAGAAAAHGLETLTLARDSTGAGVLRLRTRKTDLAAAERGGHMVTVTLRLGARVSSLTRLWRASQGRLAALPQ